MHLSHTGEQNISGKKPPHTLGTRRRRETTLVCPELLEVVDLADCHVWVDSHILDRGSVVEVDCRWVLSEEGGFVSAGVEADGDDGAGLAFCGVTGRMLARSLGLHISDGVRAYWT